MKNLLAITFLFWATISFAQPVRTTITDDGSNVTITTPVNTRVIPICDFHWTFVDGQLQMWMTGRNELIPGGRLGNFTINGATTQSTKLAALGAISDQCGGGAGGNGLDSIYFNGALLANGDTITQSDSHGYVNVRDYGANGDGTDQTTAILLAAATGKTVYFPKGDYVLNDTIFPVAGQGIFGDGYQSLIRTTLSGGLPIMLQFTNHEVWGLRLKGTKGSGGSIFQTGILIDGVSSSSNSYGINLHDLWVEDFAYMGIRAQTSFGSFTIGGTMTNIFISNCATGLAMMTRAEYYTITNLHVNNCTTGVYYSGGNNSFINCDVSSNSVGFDLISGVNELHSTISECSINHNTTAGLRATNTSLENSIENCRFYDNDIKITNSDNLKFNDCEFSGDSIIVSASDSIWFVGSDFVTTCWKSISTSSVYFVNSVGEVGFAAGKYPVANGDYILNVASGVHKWSLNTGGTTYTGSNGISLSTSDFRLGSTFIGGSALAANRKIGLGGNTLIIGDSSDSTLVQFDGSSDRVNIGNGSLLTGRLGVRAASSSVPSIELQNNSGTTGVSAYGDGSLVFGTTASLYPTFKGQIFARDRFSTGNTVNLSELGLGYSGNAGGYVHLFGSNGNEVTTSGTANGLVGGIETVAPTSSSAEYGMFSSIMTVNQTGGANGITSGFRSIPTLTSAADFRAFWAKSPTATSATVAYGTYLSPIKVSGVTTGYGIYQEGTSDLNFFAGDMRLDKTITASGTTGAQTINKSAGSVNFAAAATSLVVTNSRVTANSIVICTVGTDDTTMKSAAAVATSGSFTIFPNAAPTAETRVNFVVIN